MRSIYRDIDSLRAGGADIGGERGYGYSLIEDGSLPPQMFNRIEIEALVLGLTEVRHMGDPALAEAAVAALAKITATLPSLAQQQLLHAVSQVHRMTPRYLSSPSLDLALVREACWREQALDITYHDRSGQVTARRIWPLAIVYLDRLLVVLAWCCLRQGFRKFQVARMQTARATTDSFRPRRAAMLRDYLAQLEVEAQQASPPLPD